jgi:NAD(P)-dependent dehydrogenase (short-subunit alcohol dehydrogenase family)
MAGMASGFGTTSLGGRSAIVTGGASGIGRATAIRLAELGAHVVVTDVNEAGGAAVAAEIDGAFGVLDVGDPDAWSRVVTVFGPFDIAFLNAGISTNHGLPPEHGLPVVEMTDQAYRRIMSVNVDGVVYGTRAVLPGMIERGAGDIVVTASMAGLGPIAFDPVYGLTKHAVVGFVRSMAAAFEQAPDGPDIHISAICPGFTDTAIIGDEIRLFIEMAGLAIMPTEHIADVVARALDERVQGAQWVVWPGVEPRVYEWNPAITGIERERAVEDGS